MRTVRLSLLRPVCFLTTLASLLGPWPGRAAPFDAAPFALPLPDADGLLWEDPREVHRVVAHFKTPPPGPEKLRLEYWGSRWPQQRLPKDREPGGGDVGWMELGNWWKYNWRVADAEAKADGNTVAFTFRPVNAKEFPKEKDYAAAFRYTLKIRIAGDEKLPAIDRIEVLTDSTLEERSFRLAWEQAPPAGVVRVFNGRLLRADAVSAGGARFFVEAAVNRDPNTFDRTLVTVRRGSQTFTFKFDDLEQGALLLPHCGVAVLPDPDTRGYAALAAEQKARGAKTLYQRVAEMPEQTWRAAWDGMPPKKSHIYFPFGLDGGRQRFRLNADGSIDFRSNDHYLRNRPGQETARLDLEKPRIEFRFNLPNSPVFRTLDEQSLPVCTTQWDLDGVLAQQTAFVTPLSGTAADGPVPAPDTLTVFMAEFVFSNRTDQPKQVELPLEYRSGGQRQPLRTSGRDGSANQTIALELDAGRRGQLVVAGEAGASFRQDGPAPICALKLGSGQSVKVVLKIPYVVLTEKTEGAALEKLDFDTERKAVASYWRRRLDQSAKLLTPEPMLDEFYRSHAMHLLVNCEGEPGRPVRFARVGSFGYGAYGNESCMMVVDLERRGYHREAQQCLDAWLHYQGTVALPGSFAGKEGVLYGAGGYEAGGYNQHHGWILWMLAEHYRFTRDATWLRQASPGIVQGADWIIRETARTQDRHELERGLLPAGSLEDIGDWWTWLSTSCYSWRGLDHAAWALEQIQHPEAGRIGQAARAYHAALLRSFRQASERSPVVRLRDGTAVPKFPSHVHRRGRSFGWICETLEGAIHLLITRALDPDAPEAVWILQDYEDNLYLSNQYGYTLGDFEKDWFSRGGMSMQACLLLDVEPYLYRDDVKHALRALFNGQAVSYFPDVRLNTEHALPNMGDWRGDHFKSSDESNCAGWLRYLFVREEGETLLLGQAVPREWLRPGQRCGLEKTATWFGPASVLYTGGDQEMLAQIAGPRRNPPKEIRVRFRHPQAKSIASVTVNGQPSQKFKGEWVELPGDIGEATIRARFDRP